MNFLGTLYTGGSALIVTAVLILGVRGKGEFKFSRLQAAAVGLLAGVLYGATGRLQSAEAGIAPNVQHTLSRGPFGDVGMGAVAIVIVVIIYGTALKPRYTALLGIVAASVFAAAGGVWSMFSDSIAGFFQQLSS